jgi:hypothetical protein
MKYIISGDGVAISMSFAEYVEVYEAVKKSGSAEVFGKMPNVSVAKLPLYKCPRCKWQGTELQTEPITKDGETAIDYSDGSPIHGCPKCGEHKLKEI